VQPYIALCKGLLAEGHRPKIASHAEFGDWVRSHGIDFAPVEGNPAELMALCVDHGMFTPSFLYETNQKVCYDATFSPACILTDKQSSGLSSEGF
jgi:sterol 3beta-glucosyltransferase